MTTPIDSVLGQAREVCVVVFGEVEQRIYKQMCSQLSADHDPGDEQPLSFNEVIDVWVLQRIHQHEAAAHRISILDRYLGGAS